MSEKDSTKALIELELEKEEAKLKTDEKTDKVQLLTENETPGETPTANGLNLFCFF